MTTIWSSMVTIPTLNTKKKALQGWNKVLQFSGGDLSTEKCEYYSIDWTWTHGSPKITNKEFNIGSPKQLGEILFIEMKIQVGIKTKTGSYSTDSGILEDLSMQGHEVSKLVLDWR